MMTSKPISARSFLRDNRAASTIEFAIITPVFLIFLFGVLQAGVWMQNYNAVKSTALDGTRAIMVEYQKNNDLSETQIEGIVLARAVNAPYYLDTERLTINAERATLSRVTGTAEYDLQIQYQLESFIPGIELPLSAVTYNRPVFVVDGTLGTGV